MSRSAPSVLLAWEEFLDELLLRTASFPKNVRFTFSGRIDGLALDVYEWLVEARFSRSPSAILHRINLNLEKLRLLLRLSYKRRFLAESGLRHLVLQIDEVGRMVGGWLRQAES